MNNTTEIYQDIFNRPTLDPIEGISPAFYYTVNENFLRKHFTVNDLVIVKDDTGNVTMRENLQNTKD